MSEFLTETPEVKLYPGVIEDTVLEALGFYALIPRDYLEREGEGV